MNYHGELYRYTDSASANLDIALDTVAQAFGWENTKRIWAETRGFKTHVESTIADYPREIEMSDAELNYALKKLAETPDPDSKVKSTIDIELKGGYGDWLTDSERVFGDDVIHGYEDSKTGRKLKAQARENLLMKAKTASDAEHLEAAAADRTSRPNARSRRG